MSECSLAWYNQPLGEGNINMASSTDKLTKSVIDGLSDTRTNYAHSMNRILEEADRNDNLQAYLWGFVTSYLYNRWARYRIGIMHTPNQEHVAEMSFRIVNEILEPEYDLMTGESIPIAGAAMKPPEINLI